jgi:hypothetical protein
MRLKVGDLAIITGSKFYPERIGQIVTIIGPYENRLCHLPDGTQRWMFRYKVRHTDGIEAGYSFRNLAPLSGSPVTVESDEVATV